jgi:hypothetical protein
VCSVRIYAEYMSMFSMIITMYPHVTLAQAAGAAGAEAVHNPSAVLAVVRHSVQAGISAALIPLKDPVQALRVGR